MAPRSIRKALGAVKDQTSIGLAKVAGSSVPELEVAVVKATSHDEVPVDDKYVQELLYLTSYSRGYVNACLGLLARRLAKTRNWVVAIKSLMVTHRLLREADSTFEEELARIGRRMLCLSGFTDESRSNAWDYTAFVRTYGLYLDERLDCHVFASGQAPKRSGYDGYGSRSSYDEYRYSDREYHDDRRRDSPQRQTQNQLKTKEMKPDMLLEKLPVMQRIMERVLACRPAGAARYHRLTQMALYLILRESFQLYAEICDGIAVLLEAFFDMEYQDSTKAFDIYARSAKQGDELASFYNVCKQIGVGRSSDYPTIVKISQDHLDTLEDSLRERSRSGSRTQRPKSPEPSPPPKEESEPEDIDYNGMKALPAPPVEPVPEPEPPKPEEKEDADLLNLDKSNMVAEGDRLALALFSDAPAANGKWEPFGSSGGQQANGVAHSSLSENGKAGWELALVTEASSLAKATPNSLGGGFDKLLLDSMYEQGTVTQKSSASVPAGSASSVAIPGKPTNYLALPAPTGTIDEDPFSASLTVPPPPFVQMADMQQKQRFLVQEQQLWNQYQQNGMQGQFGYTSYYNNLQHPGYYQGMGMGGYGGYGYGYNY